MKSVFITAILALAISFTSCGNQPANKSEDKAQAVAEKKDPTNAPIKLTKDKFLAEVWDYESNPNEFAFKGELPVLIDFYADWCGPCRRVSPILDELAAEYEGKIKIYKINIDFERELASTFGVQSIPTFLYIPLTGEPGMAQGGGTKEMFKEYIDNILLKEKQL